MTLNLFFLFLFLLVNLVALLAFRMRARKMFKKHQTLMVDAMAHIERHLVRPHREFRPAGNGKTWIVVFTLNRKEGLAQTLADLRAQEPEARILVVDNGSADGTQAFLAEALVDGRVDKILLNRAEQVPQWQKSFALAQALELLSMESFDYLAWIDDDMRVKQPFAKLCVDLLRELKARDVKLVNLLVDEVQDRIHPPLETLSLLGVEVHLKASFNGAFVFAPVELFAEWGLPPTAEGVNDFGVEDWYYTRLLQAAGGRVAAIDASTHLGYRKSHRKSL